jgi:hypothetical protein
LSFHFGCILSAPLGQVNIKIIKIIHIGEHLPIDPKGMGLEKGTGHRIEK